MRPVLLLASLLLLPLAACILDDPEEETAQKLSITPETVEATQQPVAAPISDAKTDVATPQTTLQRLCATGSFPATLAVENNPDLLAGYGDVCRLSELRGVEISGTEAVYLCQSELLNDGMGDGTGFNPQTVKQKLGDAAERSTLLTTAGFAGKQFALLLLKQGNALKVVSTAEELAALPLKLRHEEAAIAMAALTGALGRGMGSGYDGKALCDATLTENATGWLLQNASAFENCKPRELRTISINRNGRVEITARHTPENSPALCVD